MLFYIFSFLEVFFCLSLILLIVVAQKSSDGMIAKNSFGPIGRTNSVVKITYVLIALFIINTFVLGTLLQKEYKSTSLTRTKNI